MNWYKKSQLEPTLWGDEVKKYLSPEPEGRLLTVDYFLDIFRPHLEPLGLTDDEIVESLRAFKMGVWHRQYKFTRFIDGIKKRSAIFPNIMKFNVEALKRIWDAIISSSFEDIDSLNQVGSYWHGWENQEFIPWTPNYITDM